MDEIEKKVMLGLYCELDAVGEDRVFFPNEIAWLAKEPLKKAKDWRGPDGRLKTATLGHSNYLDELSESSKVASRPLAYLQEKGYIDLTEAGGGFKLFLTADGVDMGRKLNTWLGRRDLWYRDNKEGVLWLTVTALLSVLTTLLTLWIKGDS